MGRIKKKCNSSIKKFVRIVGDIMLNRITPKHWDMFKAGRLQTVRTSLDGRSQKLSPTSVNLELRTLRAALNTAVRWNMLDQNPFTGLKLCKIADTDAPFITLAQFKSILGVILHEDVRDMVTLAFYTGARLGEISSLRWTEVDLFTFVIRITSNEAFKTKTGKQRGIPMNSEVSSMLLRRYQKRNITAERVFPLFRREYVSKLFKDAARLVLGENTTVHFHSLRHSFCSNLIRSGANVRIVQSLAGHSSIATTEKYLHNVTGDARHAVELLSMN